LKESGKEITLEDIKNTQITILSQEEKEKMSKNFWNITKANRPFIIEGSQEMKEREKNFNLTIGNKNSDFYVLKYKDNVISFCSFTPDEDGNLYIESLNTESEAKGSHIGSEFLPSVLEKVKNSRKDIYGHVHTHNSGTLPYYERLGFDVKQVEENGELKYYEIRIKAQQKQEQSSMAA
jgi:ribosomal protein S18 acetylase RimI-like enzyme